MNRQFPPEIVQLIVKASLKPYDIFITPFEDLTTRYSILKSYALLNSIWRAFSDPELARWIEIDSEASANKFLELAAQRGGMVKEVEDLFVNSTKFDDPSTLSHLLRSTPNLINLCCANCKVDTADLANLVQLRRLVLDSVEVVGSLPSPVNNCIPKLSQLRTHETTVDLTAAHFLTPAFLPQLRYLNINSYLLRPNSIEPLVKQIERLAVDVDEGEFLPSIPESLLLLSVAPGRFDRRVILSHLSVLPAFLSIDFSEDLVADLQQEIKYALEDILASGKTGLRVIILGQCMEDVELNALVGQCAEKGVRVEKLNEVLDFAMAFSKMEEILAEKKRAAELSAQKMG